MKYPVTDIVGHSDIAPGRKTDPGHFFDWNLINCGKFVMFKKVFILFFLIFDYLLVVGKRKKQRKRNRE